ncbi:MAG: hypothetical protein ACO34J_08640, partial [Prochlorothrix sp.]
VLREEGRHGGTTPTEILLKWDAPTPTPLKTPRPQHGYPYDRPSPTRNQPCKLLGYVEEGLQPAPPSSHPF